MFRRAFLLVTLSCALTLPAQAKGDHPVVHTVYDGHTLGKIAKRYRVSIDAICNANGIGRNAKIKPKQKLVIPARSDEDGALARKMVSQGKFETQGVPGQRPGPKQARGEETPAPEPRAAPSVDADWRRFTKPARRKGYVILQATGRRWSGYAIIKGNRISSRAHAAFRRVLYSWRTGEEHEVDPRLIRLLTEISDKFGGRPLKVASGFREHSFSRESKHKSGRACDFSIEGLPNEALVAYLSTLSGVGVGYYPNSSFVHVDVRPKATRWTDYSAPGEAPRRAVSANSHSDAGTD